MSQAWLGRGADGRFFSGNLSHLLSFTILLTSGIEQNKDVKSMLIEMMGEILSLNKKKQDSALEDLLRSEEFKASYSRYFCRGVTDIRHYGRNLLLKKCMPVSCPRI
jgi:hypothetical protein